MESLKRYRKFYLSFKGRLNRKAYISITIKELLLLTLYSGVFIALPNLTNQEIGKFITILSLIIMGIMFVVITATIVASQITSVVKRIHDLDFSGYWILLIFFLEIIFNWVLTFITIPLLVIIILFIGLVIFFIYFIGVFFIRGTKGENKYGPDPLQEGKLHIPQLSKSILLPIIGLPIICLVASLSTLFIEKGFNEGWEGIKKGYSEEWKRTKKEMKNLIKEGLEEDMEQQ